MGILSRLARWAYPSLPPANLAASGPQDAYAVADLLPRFELGKAKWPDFDPARYDTDAYRKLALVFRCLSLIAHAAGTAKVRVYDEANDDEEIEDHPMRLLIRQPNPRMGEARFWGNVALRAGVAGFCVVEKVRDGFGDVTALNPLRSPWLKAIPRGGGVYDWEYKIPGVTPAPTLAAEDVVPFTWADTPDGSPYGLPPLATAIRDVAILDKLTQYVGNLLDSGGVPQYMLIPRSLPGQKMTQEDIDRQERRWRERRGGIERRGLPWIADDFDRVEQLSLNPDEIAMECVRDLSDLAICQAFGVPPRKAGVRVGLEHTTQNATAAVEDGEFYRDTIVPLWARLDDALTTSLLPDFEPPESTVSLEFDTSGVQALQEDRNEKARAVVVPGFTAGLISNHMALTELGMQIPEGLPEYYLRSISVEAIPADDPLQTTVTTTTTPPPARPAGQEGALSALAVVSPTNGHHARPGPSETLKKRKAVGAANKRLISNVAEARQPSIARFLGEQAERVAASVEQPLGVALALSNGRAPETYALADFDWTAEVPLLGNVLRRLHLIAVESAYDAASDHLGVDLSFDPASPVARSLLDRLGARATTIVEETRRRIETLVVGGHAAGISAVDIAAEVRASSAFGDGRAATIAHTEAMVSVNEGTVSAYADSGLVDRVQMFDSPIHCDDYGAVDGLTCCERNEQIVTLPQTQIHISGEHPNGSLNFAPVLIGEEV